MGGRYFAKPVGSGPFRTGEETLLRGGVSGRANCANGPLLGTGCCILPPTWDKFVEELFGLIDERYGGSLCVLVDMLSFSGREY